MRIFSVPTEEVKSRIIQPPGSKDMAILVMKFLNGDIKIISFFHKELKFLNENWKKKILAYCNAVQDMYYKFPIFVQ